MKSKFVTRTYGALGTDKMDLVPNIGNLIVKLKEMSGRFQLLNKKLKSGSYGGPRV